jgi:hypothetical protein
METSARLKIREQVMSRQLGEDCVMLDLDSGTYFGLDAVGARVWQLIDEGRSFEEVCDVLAGEYEAGREQIAADVARLLKELAANGLVVPA